MPGTVLIENVNLSGRQIAGQRDRDSKLRHAR